ncbi:hypothetical protein [Flaviflexus huanghaiensis]|uniref:hypothetical protein n=1 Tax=Flaviflexus huanghaiensis TaxID=1111473 RepID=UPI0015F8A41E|nr:hypothetical protein [Flaviflexus huanghaiensis]
MAIALGASLLAGCGSAEDLKSRWLVLPQPPEAVTRFGPGTSEIADLDLVGGTFSVQLLDAFDPGVFPHHGNSVLPMSFDSGRTVIDVDASDGPVSIRLSFTEDDIYYSDANGDTYQDALIVLDQTSLSYASEQSGIDGESAEERRGTGLLALTYSEGSATQAFYLNVGPLESVSAIDGGFSLTTGRVDGLTDTIEMGWPEGVPVRIDDHGGAIQCSRSIAEIEEAYNARPVGLKTLAAVPEKSEIAGYEEQAAFPLPGDAAVTRNYPGFDRMIFLLDGGDMTRWTDYRCGWTPVSDR